MCLLRRQIFYNERNLGDWSIRMQPACATAATLLTRLPKPLIQTQQRHLCSILSGSFNVMAVVPEFGCVALIIDPNLSAPGCTAILPFVQHVPSWRLQVMRKAVQLQLKLIASRHACFVFLARASRRTSYNESDTMENVLGIYVQSVAP